MFSEYHWVPPLVALNLTATVNHSHKFSNTNLVQACKRWYKNGAHWPKGLSMTA